MRVVIAGGGTGGHIYPALAIAKELDAEILYIGGQKGIEKDILPQSGLEYKLLDVVGFSRKLSLKNLVTAYKAVKSTRKSKAILKDFRPDFVVVTGGYVSGPVGQAASSLKIPLFLQEQNSYPGITIKLLAKRARKIFLGSRGAEKYLPPKKCFFTGNPVRKEIIQAKRDPIRESLDLGGKTLLLITGGSQGSKAINNQIRGLYNRFKKQRDWVVIHHTGRYDFEAVKEVATSYPKIRNLLGGEVLSIAENIFITPFIHDMASVLAASDLVVSRAGAIFLSEAAVLGVPLMMVPFPYAAENHQFYNARIWAEKEAGILIPESEIDRIADELFPLLGDRRLLEKMSNNAKHLGNPSATHLIVSEIKASL